MPIPHIQHKYDYYYSLTTANVKHSRIQQGFYSDHFRSQAQWQNIVKK